MHDVLCRPKSLVLLALALALAHQVDKVARQLGQFVSYHMYDATLMQQESEGKERS